MGSHKNDSPKKMFTLARKLAYLCIYFSSTFVDGYYITSMKHDGHCPTYLCHVLNCIVYLCRLRRQTDNLNQTLRGIII